MSSTHLDSNLEAVYFEVLAATRPEDVFGTEAMTVRTIKARFDELRIILNPNLYTRIEDVNAARDGLTTLRRWYDNAIERIEAGTYNSIGTEVVIVSRNTSYTLGGSIAQGDNATIFTILKEGERRSEGKVLKLAHSPEENDFLRRESQRLQYFRNVSELNPIRSLQLTLPKLFDHFQVDGREAMVLSAHQEHFSITDIMAHFKGSLPAPHAAWIARRVLALPITAEIAGLVHTAITPDHILVHPIKHEPIYLGWGHAQDLSNRHPVRAISSVFYEWYPPEVFDHKLPDQSTDVYLAGKTIEYLFQDQAGKYHDDVPQHIIELLATCTAADRKDRPEDLRQLFADFTTAVRAAWGKQYRALNLD